MTNEEILSIIRSTPDGTEIRVLTNPALNMEVGWRLGLTGSRSPVWVEGYLRKSGNDQCITSFLEYGCVWDRIPLTRMYWRRRPRQQPLTKTAIYQHVIAVIPSTTTA